MNNTCRIFKIESILYDEWKEKLDNDGIFEEEKDVNKWIVNEDNLEEFMEALHLESYYEETQDMKELLLKDGRKQATFSEFLNDLKEDLMGQKKVELNALVNSDEFNLPADRISKFLKTLIKDFKVHIEEGSVDEEAGNYLLNEAKFAQTQIRTIFQTPQDAIKKIDTQVKMMKGIERGDIKGAKKGRQSVLLNDKMQWFNEFSDIGSEMMSQNNLTLAKAQSVICAHSSQDAQVAGETATQQSNSSPILYQSKYQLHEKDLEDIDKLQFDIWKVTQKLTDEFTLPLMTLKCVNDLGLNEMISNKQFGSFLDKINRVYVHDVQYHNHLHGADVMQFSHYLLTTCNLESILKLSKLDCLSLIIASVCHDLGHDGYTNSYHVNAITERAIDSNDHSVQETFHAAELFRILNQGEFNFLEGLSRQEFKVFRKRVTGLILSTDMAQHAAMLTSLKTTLEEHEIKNGQNVNVLIDNQDDVVAFKHQQLILENAIHQADISQQTRSFSIVHDWTYLLFDEFFMQGDLEKEMSLPISMLCDRESTNVAKSQGGFISYVVQPIVLQMVNIMPQLQECIEQLKSNKDDWASYVETEEDLRVYKKVEEEHKIIGVSSV